jgi:PAS domain S-box-containing protein
MQYGLWQSRCAIASIGAMKSLPHGLLEGPKHYSRGMILLLGCMGGGAVALLQRLMPSAASFELWYLAPVAFVAWGAGPRAASLLSVACAGFMAANDWSFALRGANFTGLLVCNVISRIFVFCVAGWLISKWTEAARDLKESINQHAAQCQAMLETAMDGFASVDRGGRLTEVNEPFCRMLGCERTDLVGSEVRHFEMKESPQETREHIARISAAGRDRFESRLRHKDGAAIDVEVSVSVIPGGDGALVCFVREIGERKRGEARRRETEERYRTLAESSPDAIFIVDKEVRIQYANSAAAALWGQTPDALLGISQAALFSGETAEKHMAAAARAFASGESVRLDESLLSPTGNHWIETRLVPVRAANGQVHSLIVIAVDISERKRTEALFKAQRDLALRLSLTSDLKPALDALLEVAINLEGVDCGGVYLSDRRTGDLDLAASQGPLNPEFLSRVAHYPANAERVQLVKQGQPVYLRYSELPFTTKDDPETLRAAAILPLCHEGVVVGCLNLASHTQDAIPRHSRIAMEALAAQAAGAIARIRAETDQRLLEKQILEITDREQARIGQELHDGLCQQLVSLAFDANALQAELTGTKSGEVTVAARIAQYLDKCISEARQLSRGLFPVRLEAEGLPSALEELSRATETRFGVRCVIDCDEHLPLRNATMAVHLYRIAQEAVTNALKHARAKTIRVQLHAENGNLKLEVEDDGIGFSATRSDASGMGLHIMDYRAKSIGGVLQLSRRSHGGTSVSCCIPSAEREKMPA